MSVAGLNYHKFVDQVAAEQRVFTFTRDGELLVYPVRGQEVVPFWSSRSRLDTVQERFPKYQAHTAAEIGLAEFYDWLKQLEEEGIRVGVNWSGQRLTGYDVGAADIRAMLEARVQSGSNESGA